MISVFENNDMSTCAGRCAFLNVELYELEGVNLKPGAQQMKPIARVGHSRQIPPGGHEPDQTTLVRDPDLRL
jgi:hypothetical protein